MSIPQTLILSQEVINGGNLRPSPLPARFDSTLVSANVKDSELRHVEPFLCSELYLDMIAVRNPLPSNYNINLGALVEAFPNNAEYETLWKEHLIELLAFAVTYESLPFIGLQVGSTGIMLNDTEFGTNGGTRSIKFLQDTYLKRIQLKQERLVGFLCANYEQYPLFCKEKYCSDCGEGSKNKYPQGGAFDGLVIY